ncbi:MAG: ADP-glyceromanno-heptose 6-epimerase [Deltaproteobacteria bacterium]|jgi:ADP-glyceromanno-heptose 6-epimerase precursor (EC 5.1.3.20)|uniref:ADP-L-glycero-D-manno-heptose-6-epimerase n=1 Tax=Candidatus Acidulodesulfobacterium acidiphilum TaxID=2597224 RepID=A0A520XH80_9DELT|nr:ADP-glyceromanno-heptose 6-epimerase [Deltaproteobacteria bacterium]RZV40435.1 MAG: ADP-glyceromanno-heptose 6-epimerase [Candidatus Acidulodesulfobacterium acidiphilum]
MIVVTGGAGFIGSNIIEELNKRGESNILVVDNLTNGKKMYNLHDLDILDYMDREDFIERIKSNYDFGKITAIFHEGACSSTTEWDGKFIMRNNFEYSKELLKWCQENEAQYIYASSASVYGLGKKGFTEKRECELPINMYAYSKFQFDQFVRSVIKSAKYQIAGFRYFNVYGPRESHKGTMSSVAYHFNNQIIATGKAKLFEGTDGYGNGEQRRDFVYVEDCAKINLWFMDNPSKSGIFNIGTGNARSFNDVANAVIKYHGKGSLEYVKFPEHLKGAYQSFTEADIAALRNIGYKENFTPVEEGVKKYLGWLNR